MTTELTDTELRVKCAEACGFLHEWLHGGNSPSHNDDLTDGDSLVWKIPGGGYIRDQSRLPNYPSDPVAALTLVDNLRKEGWHCWMDNTDEWNVEFLRDAPQRSSYNHSDQSFCRAICRAFLAVKGKV